MCAKVLGLRHTVTFATPEILEGVALMLLNLVHGQFGLPKAWAYSGHRMTSTIFDGSLGLQLTLRNFQDIIMCRLDVLEPRTRSVWVP